MEPNSSRGVPGLMGIDRNKMDNRVGMRPEEQGLLLSFVHSAHYALCSCVPPRFADAQREAEG